MESVTVVGEKSENGLGIYIGHVTLQVADQCQVWLTQLEFTNLHLPHLQSSPLFFPTTLFHSPHYFLKLTLKLRKHQKECVYELGPGFGVE